MTYPAVLPPSQEPLAIDQYAQCYHKGLFAAPWLERPDPLEIVAAQQLSRSLAHAPAAPSDWTPAFSHLMEVRSHCLLAASALDPIPARHHYGDALKTCKVALNILHHATDGPEGALARWALGTHTLIQAQLAMPDLEESERLARHAIVMLSSIGDPLYAGAEQDAHAATRLAREPQELHWKMEGLCDRIGDKLAYYRFEIDRQEALLNQRLAGVVRAHSTALRSVLVWGLLNLALMASLPLNGQFAPDVPWSLPLAVAVPVLWWWTWDRPYRSGMRFFDWIRSIKADSLTQLTDAVANLISPARQFSESAADLLRQARLDREVLAAYHLFTLPSSADTVEDAAQLVEEGSSVLAGQWCIELNDSHPWPLDEVLAARPSRLPNGIRIYFGSGGHM
ncbi:MAG TPA: hypothetical protein VD969_11380 [Symbiobacteriaceae bacterium]|nr:hypothetical protein [Symbiobacteriaceae bacterium]